MTACRQQAVSRQSSLQPRMRVSLPKRASKPTGQHMELFVKLKPVTTESLLDATMLGTSRVCTGLFLRQWF